MQTRQSTSSISSIASNHGSGSWGDILQNVGRGEGGDYGGTVGGWVASVMFGWVVVVLGVVVMLASGLLSPPEVSGSPPSGSSGSSRPHGLHSVRPLPGGRPGRNLQRESATERVSSRESVAVSKRVSERVSWTKSHQPGKNWENCLQRLEPAPKSSLTQLRQNPLKSVA